MVETKRFKSRGPNRIPTLRFEGEDYFIDNRLHEFRTVTPPVGAIEFVHFSSSRGLRMLNECTGRGCRQCGRVLYFSGHRKESDVRCCDCGDRGQIRHGKKSAPSTR